MLERLKFMVYGRCGQRCFEIREDSFVDNGRVVMPLERGSRRFSLSENLFRGMSTMGSAVLGFLVGNGIGGLLLPSYPVWALTAIVGMGIGGPLGDAVSTELALKWRWRNT